MSRTGRVTCCRLEHIGTWPIQCPACNRVHWRAPPLTPRPHPPEGYEPDPTMGAFEAGFFSGVLVAGGLALALFAVLSR